MMRITKILIASLLMASPFRVWAQDVSVQESAEIDGPLVLPPLFDYPVAPEDMPWEERSNWLVEHFWDNFDFKQKSVGQSQLVHAFRTYVVPMHLADRDVAVKSVDALIKKIQKNPGLLLQFTQAAERTIYEPQTSELMIDEVYVRFLKAVTSNKKIPELRRARYKSHLNSLEHCLVNGPMPSFSFMDRSGSGATYTAAGVPTIIEFGDFDCSDCRITRLRLETDSELQDLVAQGKARILFINPDMDADSIEEWREAVKDYPENWTVGAGEDLDDSLDLRIVPCLYLIDASGRIVSKSASSESARAFVKSEVQ